MWGYRSLRARSCSTCPQDLDLDGGFITEFMIWIWKIYALDLDEEFIDHKTSIITDEDLLRGLLFYKDLGLSHALHVLTDLG